MLNYLSAGQILEISLDVAIYLPSGAGKQAPMEESWDVNNNLPQEPEEFLQIGIRYPIC